MLTMWMWFIRLKFFNEEHVYVYIDTFMPPPPNFDNQWTISSEDFLLRARLRLKSNVNTSHKLHFEIKMDDSLNRFSVDRSCLRVFYLQKHTKRACFLYTLWHRSRINNPQYQEKDNEDQEGRGQILGFIHCVCWHWRFPV